MTKTTIINLTDLPTGQKGWKLWRESGETITAGSPWKIIQNLGGTLGTIDWWEISIIVSSSILRNPKISLGVNGNVVAVARLAARAHMKKLPFSV